MDEVNILQELRKQTELLEKILYALALDMRERDRREDFEGYLQRWRYGDVQSHRELVKLLYGKQQWSIE